MSAKTGVRTAARIALALAMLAPAPAAAQDCSDFNTEAFFEAATAEQVRACLAAGADVGARTELGMTPLHWAAGSGTPEAIRALLDAGADAAAKTERGSTPFDVAKEHNAGKLEGTAEWWELNEGQYR